MKNRILSLILMVFLLCGCQQSASRRGVGFAFETEDVVAVDAYYYLENFTDSARKKIVTDAENIQYLYTTLTSLTLQPVLDDSDKYGANISAFRFNLSDGSSYEVVYEGYGVKDGILTAQDLSPHATTADINGLWFNLTVDAEGCSEEELPLPFHKVIPEETTAPKVYSGEEAEVHQLVFDFLAVKQVDFISDTDHSFAEYFEPALRDSLETQLFWKVFRFEKLVRSSICEKILWEEFHIFISDLQINGDIATVTAYDTYEYELSNANGIISSRGTGYSLTCHRIEDRWYITEVDTDNETIEEIVDGYSAEQLPALAGISEASSVPEG